MPDKPILDYARSNTSPSVAWRSATALPEFAFGILAGEAARFIYYQGINSDRQNDIASIIMRSVLNTLVTTTIACLTVWITRVVAGTIHPRENRSFRVRVGIGFVYVWISQLINIASLAILLRNGISFDSGLYIACPLIAMILLAIVAGIIMSPRKYDVR